jgi:hypothetical protein
MSRLVPNRLQNLHIQNNPFQLCANSSMGALGQRVVMLFAMCRFNRSFFQSNT